MHPVIEFYLEQRKSQHNLSLQDMWAMPKRMVGDAYLYIPWLFLSLKVPNGIVQYQFLMKKIWLFLLEMKQFKINIYILLILFWIILIYTVNVIKFTLNLN